MTLDLFILFIRNFMIYQSKRALPRFGWHGWVKGLQMAQNYDDSRVEYLLSLCALISLYFIGINHLLLG